MAAKKYPTKFGTNTEVSLGIFWRVGMPILAPGVDLPTLYRQRHDCWGSERIKGPPVWMGIQRLEKHRALHYNMNTAKE